MVRYFPVKRRFQRYPAPAILTTVAPLFGGIQLRVELAGASRTYAVAEGGFRVLGDVTFRYDEKVKVLRSLSKFILNPLIHTLLGFNCAQYIVFLSTLLRIGGYPHRWGRL
jgi:hypothetical protein